MLTMCALWQLLFPGGGMVGRARSARLIGAWYAAIEMPVREAG